MGQLQALHAARQSDKRRLGITSIGLSIASFRLNCSNATPAIIAALSVHSLGGLNRRGSCLSFEEDR